MRNKTHELALASLLAALAATLLSLGTLVPLATYAAPLLASVALLVARQECRASLAWGCWLVSAALGLLLAADREAALLYAFFGWYPLLKPRLDALRPMPLRMGVKLLLCLVSVGSMYALALFVLQLEALAQEFADSSRALLWATALLGIALFLAYDQALARLTAAYQKRRTRRS